MINIGEVHCGQCGDAFEPDGLPSFDEPNFCSGECEDRFDLGELVDAQERSQRGLEQIYNEGRYGGAEMF